MKIDGTKVEELARAQQKLMRQAAMMKHSGKPARKAAMNLLAAYGGRVVR